MNIKNIDWKKIGSGALIAMVGALLTYLTPFVTGLDLGDATPIVVAFWSVIVNIVRKSLADYTV